MRSLLFTNTCDETVAPSYNGGDVAMVALPVTEGATQSANLDRQAFFCDDRCWPHAGEELLFADLSAGPVDERDQNVDDADSWQVSIR